MARVQGLGTIQETGPGVTGPGYRPDTGPGYKVKVQSKSKSTELCTVPGYRAWLQGLVTESGYMDYIQSLSTGSGKRARVQSLGTGPLCTELCTGTEYRAWVQSLAIAPGYIAWTGPGYGAWFTEPGYRA
jgi:hypothetical protein